MNALNDTQKGEVDKFIEVYAESVKTLIGNDPIPIKNSRARKEIKAFALTEAMRAAPWAAECYEIRRAAIAQGHRGKPRTEKERVGHSLMSDTGHVWRTLPGRWDAASSGRSGFSGLYQELASICDILPPDNVMAMAAGMTTDGVTSARAYAREDGYEFEEMSGKKMGDLRNRSAWWKVIKRPEVALDNSESTAELRQGLADLLKDIELRQELVVLLKGVLGDSGKQS